MKRKPLSPVGPLAGADGLAMERAVEALGENAPQEQDDFFPDSLAEEDTPSRKQNRKRKLDRKHAGKMRGPDW